MSLIRADQAYWTLVLLSPDQIETAARELLNATKKFNRYGRDSRQLVPFSPDGWLWARNRYFDARKALVLAVKDISKRAD